MAIETQLSVFVKNRVGMLNELCTEISEANINIR
nr:ACT domain-containing protein [Candidatus Dadabacteria bacterium]